MRNQSEILVDILRETSNDSRELRIEATKRLIAELLCIDDSRRSTRENNRSCVVLMTR